MSANVPEPQEPQCLTEKGPVSNEHLDKKLHDKVPDGLQNTQQKASSAQEPPQDMALLMGFSGFKSTKNKKVQPKKSGGKQVEKKVGKNAKYRQYVNRKNKKLVQ
ncbi:LAME_0F16732g1_1 [Lachancea meyersii CBS 8951]|uniref:LAME_0F16732g1_1 n=1 Tax=Lachancea meyersii CBS 8951 TaxID=1266667 RepID=A0A1G4JZD7_9SACH|nr:LAME_0F16732g1_1 [Lachancea meyersii CBS 8951]